MSEWDAWFILIVGYAGGYIMRMYIEWSDYQRKHPGIIR